MEGVRSFFFRMTDIDNETDGERNFPTNSINF